MAQSEERRRHPRSQRGFDQPQATVSGSIIKHVDNISCSGVLCRMENSLPLMEKLMMTLDLPDFSSDDTRFSVECEGVVVRNERVECDVDGPEYQVAIFFTHLSDDARRHVAGYVEQDLKHS